MKKNIIYLSFVLFLMTLSSCQMMVEVDVPKQDPKLVVFCFLTPDDEKIRVIVRTSSPLFSDENLDSWSVKDDATVTLSRPNQSVNIPFVVDMLTYELDAASFPIIPGETYQLEVSAPGYKPVIATTRVPLQIPVFTVNTVTQSEQTNQNGYTELVHKFDLRWLDTPGQEDFYEVSIQRYESELQYFPVTDEYHDGETVAISPIVLNSPDGGTQEPFRVYLLHTTEDYYLYKNSLENLNFGDPFSEPSLLYSNIENGLGCFTSYVGSSVLIIP
ncbi:MAG: DUF4249 domain-containing protein [Flavobacteriales bacterium]|nr:DUF4249 domain-containing protein [Flavobacteriales bacterium]